MNKDNRRLLIQISLFIATIITTTIAGAEWTHGRSLYDPSHAYRWNDFASGFEFSIPFLLILTVHEFGHYFTALSHKVKTSLPYYIPLPPMPLSIGTMGALIRLRTKVNSLKQNFDIGLAGPLAGFIMSLVVLYYGFTHLPPAEHIFTIHPEYEAYGSAYADHVYTQEYLCRNKENPGLDIKIGKNLLFILFEKYVAQPGRAPNVHEIMHYPWLFAGFLSLVFTSLNLLPIGQLDGGHVAYGLFGYKKHRIIASVIFVAFMFYAGLGFVKPSDPPTDLIIWIPVALLILYFAFQGLGLRRRDTVMYAVVIFTTQFVLSAVYPDLKGYTAWLVFGVIVGRLVGVAHPRSLIEEPLSQSRIILGWIALIIFALCFTPAPIELIVPQCNN